MADLENPVRFSPDTTKLIQDYENCSTFCHTQWGESELLSIRSEARKHYRTEQKGKCAFCKEPVSLKSVMNCQVEHIVPKSLHLDFIFMPKNLCVICADCNEIKRNQETMGVIPNTLKSDKKRKIYPRSSGAFLIVHPHFDIYDEHILIVNGLYVDKGSKKGIFTIGACNLNRKLAEFGWEPELISEDELISDMNTFIDEKDSLKRAKSLNKIKKTLFNI